MKASELITELQKMIAIPFGASVLNNLNFRLLFLGGLIPAFDWNA